MDCCHPEYLVQPGSQQAQAACPALRLSPPPPAARRTSNQVNFSLVLPITHCSHLAFHAAATKALARCSMLLAITAAANQHFDATSVLLGQQSNTHRKTPAQQLLPQRLCDFKKASAGCTSGSPVPASSPNPTVCADTVQQSAANNKARATAIRERAMPLKIACVKAISASAKVPSLLSCYD